MLSHQSTSKFLAPKQFLISREKRCMCNTKPSVLFTQRQQHIGKHFTLFFSSSLALLLRDEDHKAPWVLKLDGWGTLLSHVMGSPWALQPRWSDPTLKWVTSKTSPFRKSWEWAREKDLTLVVFCYQNLSSSSLPFKWGKARTWPFISFLVKWYVTGTHRSHLWKTSSFWPCLS